MEPLELRRAAEADLDQILALSLDAHGPDAWSTVYASEREGVDAWTVVVDGDRVVSTCMLLSHTVEMEHGGTTVSFPAGQVEFVATHPEYQRRGLVRAQFDVHHDQAEQRGDHVLFVTGIPYFYRRLGYGFGVEYPERYRVQRASLRSHVGWTVSEAGKDDLPAAIALHEHTLARAALRILRPARDWHAIIDRDPALGPGLFVARRGDEVRGWMRCERSETEGRCELLQAATVDLAAGEVLLRHALDLAGDLALGVLTRPHDPFGALVSSIGSRTDDFHAVYTRIVDPVGFLEVLRPVLSSRLTSSVLADEEGELVLSMFTRSIVLSYEKGTVGTIRWADAIEDPEEADVVGVPPDAFDALVLGRFGATGLAARFDDVTLGRERALMDILFPRLVTDVVGVF